MRGMMGGGAMGPPPIMFRKMFALMDADSDGSVSLQEFQAAHERIFRAMDGNKDGKLTARDQRVGSAAVGSSVDLLDGLHGGRRRQEGEQLPIFVEREPAPSFFLVSGFGS